MLDSHLDDPLSASNKDELIKEFLRKNFFKFYINIYRDQTKSTTNNHTSRSSNMNSGGSATPLEDSSGASRYMLDIHLFKGTVYVFMDFVRKFIHIMTSQCSLCDSSCATSSNHSSLMDGKQHHDYNLKMIV